MKKMMIPTDATDQELEDFAGAVLEAFGTTEKGGAGSGNFAHAGRPGEVGGSSSEGGVSDSSGAGPVRTVEPGAHYGVSVGSDKIQGVLDAKMSAKSYAVVDSDGLPIVNAKRFEVNNGTKSIIFRRTTPKVRELTIGAVSAFPEDLQRQLLLNVDMVKVTASMDSRGITAQYKQQFNRTTGEVSKVVNVSNSLLEDGPLAEPVIAHELSHVLDYSFNKYIGSSLSDTKEFGAVIEKAPKAITKYALTDEKEYFAEHSLAYQYSPEKLKEVNPIAHKFFDELYGGKRDYTPREDITIKSKKASEDVDGYELDTNDDFKGSIVELIQEKLIQSSKGGSGSGNFGHSGRPGEVGGSGAGGEAGSAISAYSERATRSNDGVIHTSNVEDAVIALHRNEKVELSQPREVSTLLERLKQVVNDAEARGEKAPSFNLCNVSVEGTNLFCAESKGIPRIKMPQLKGIATPGSRAAGLTPDVRGEVDVTPMFQKYLADSGFKIEELEERADHLRASQNELNGGKVAGIAQALRDGKLADERILVSKDNYIVDGHHRWAATVGVDLDDNNPGDLKMKVARVDMDIIELLAESNKFAADWGIPQLSAKRSPCDGMTCKGGAGSGNFGHAGRPGAVGGSGEGAHATERRGHVEPVGARAIDTPGVIAKETGMNMEESKLAWRAFQYYKRDGYKGIRKIQNGGRAKEPLEAEYARVIEKYIDLAPKFTTDGKIYRGIDSKALAKEFKSGKIKEGDVIDMKGTSSWTTDETIGKVFGGEAKLVVYTNSDIPKSVSIKHLGGMKGEEEVLASKDMRYEVKGIREVTERREPNEGIGTYRAPLQKLTYVRVEAIEPKEKALEKMDKPEDAEQGSRADIVIMRGGEIIYEYQGEESEKGGAGSGNFGHFGRPGERGGSASEGGTATQERPIVTDREGVKAAFPELFKESSKGLAVSWILPDGSAIEAHAGGDAEAGRRGYFHEEILKELGMEENRDALMQGWVRKASPNGYMFNFHDPLAVASVQKDISLNKGKLGELLDLGRTRFEGYEQMYFEGMPPEDYHTGRQVTVPTEDAIKRGFSVARALERANKSLTDGEKAVFIQLFKGGAGSGNFGHVGRPGEVGGSGSGGTTEITHNVAAAAAAAQASMLASQALQDKFILPDPDKNRPWTEHYNGDWIDHNGNYQNGLPEQTTDLYKTVPIFDAAGNPDMETIVDIHGKEVTRQKMNYTDDRKAWHDKEVAKAMTYPIYGEGGKEIGRGNIEPVPEGEKPVATIMIGGPGSGKTSVAKSLIDKEKNVFVNADDNKESMPEFQVAVFNRALDAAGMAHEESSDIAAKTLREASNTRRNLIYDGTGKNLTKYEAIFNDLHSKGYRINVVVVELEKKAAIERIKERSKVTGRVVMKNVVEKIEKAYGSDKDVEDGKSAMTSKNGRTLGEVAEKLSQDSGFMVANNNGTQSSIAYERLGSAKSVHDEPFMKEWSAKIDARKYG